MLTHDRKVIEDNIINIIGKIKPFTYLGRDNEKWMIDLIRINKCILTIFRFPFLIRFIMDQSNPITNTHFQLWIRDAPSSIIKSMKTYHQCITPIAKSYVHVINSCEQLVRNSSSELQDKHLLRALKQSASPIQLKSLEVEV